MSIAWIAAAIRGQALARRGLGAEGLERVSAQKSLPAALRLLADSTYGHALKADMELEAADRAVSATALWHLRVLAGWLPPEGVQLVRAFACWFELHDLENRAVALAIGATRPVPPHPLGALATVWRRAADARSLVELRTVLAHSEWGDPGGDTLPDVLLGLRVGWARILRRAVDDHPEWGEGALALVLARARFLRTATPGSAEARRVPEFGRGWESARTLGAFVERLPMTARWLLRDTQDPRDLWRAERHWWLRLRRDAAALLESWRLGRPTVVGAAALLLADCWGTQVALAHAARGGAREARSDAAA